MTKLNVTYLCNSVFPSERANSVHVMKMSQAFSKQTRSYQLIGLANGNPSPSELFQYYDTEAFDLKLFRYLRVPRILDICAWRASRMVKRSLVDLVYSRFTKGSRRTSQLGIPTVHEIHADIWNKNAEHEALLNEIVYGPGTLGIVAISEGLKRAFQAKYPDFDESRIFVAHDGADPQDLSQLRKEQNPKFRIGYLGSLNEGRGIEIIEGLANRLADKNFEFHILGGSKQEVEHWSSRFPDTAHFHGYVPHCDVKQHISQLDVCLMPYQKRILTGSNSLDTAQYTSPLKMFEYMSLRKTIISSNLPVLQEVLNEKNSILVDPKDLSAWESAVVRLAEDSLLREQLAQQALDDFNAEYSWHKRVERILGWCSDLLAAKQQGGVKH